MFCKYKIKRKVFGMKVCKTICQITLVLRILLIWSGTCYGLYNIDEEVKVNDFVLKYDGQSNLFHLHVNFLSVNEISILIPQVCVDAGQCDMQESTSVKSCAELNASFASAGWYHETVNQTNCFREAGSWVDKQLMFGSIDGNHSVYVASPSQIHITTNDDLLQKYNLNSSHAAADDYHVKIRLLYILELQMGETFSVSVKTFDLVIENRQRSGAVIAVQNECVARGLTSPIKSTLQTTDNIMGDRICRWNCRDDHVRYPYHSPPVEKNASTANVSTIDAICYPLPKQALALVFTFKVEIRHIVHPSMVEQRVLSDLDRIGLEIEAKMAQQYYRPVVLVELKDSIYSDIPLIDLLERNIRFFSRGPGQVQEYQLQVVETGESVAPSSGTRRRLLEEHNQQLVVNGIVITNATNTQPVLLERRTQEAFAAVQQTYQPSSDLLKNFNAFEIAAIQLVTPVVDEGDSSGGFSVSMQRLLVTCIEAICGVIIFTLLFFKNS